MPRNKGSIKFTFTREQQEQIRKETGTVGDALELDIMELEERIAPGIRHGG
jgi:hypothetical protein